MIGGNRLASNENSLNVSSTIGDYGHYLFHRRQRGEKRTIPEEQKDEKYFERRKRNNEAAKKSRDARKIREDRVSKCYNICHIWRNMIAIALITDYFAREIAYMICKS